MESSYRCNRNTEALIGARNEKGRGITCSRNIQPRQASRLQLVKNAHGSRGGDNPVAAEKGDNMSDFMVYQKAGADREAAFQQYCYAGVNLELCKIRERMAEIKSQHEPLASLIEKPISERDRLYAVAFYVVNGRFPE
jgi:hypothetical protein